MQAVIDGKSFRQQYPINSDDPKYVKDIDARKLWNKIVHNAWKSAEPGVLFWDTIKKESVPDCYADLGYETVSTNPCGEIPLCPYDSCRLIAINLFSYVKDPFTPKASFDYDLFRRHVHLSQRIMDDIIDLEQEKIDAIIEKIKADPEDDELKRVEQKMWEKTVFLVEIGQAGIFRIVNVPGDQVEPLLAVACPNILFPYAREVVSDAVTRAGFAPIVLQPVNFEAMYMQRLQEQASASTPTEVTIQ